MKKLFNIARKLTANLTWKMVSGLLSKPLLLLPTVWATIESILFSKINFEENSGARGVANAFRHAAWNLLIAKNCTLFTTREKAVHWAKFTTDLHEDCFPNEPFDHEMDLHNNRVGREVFEKLAQQRLSKKEMMAKLLRKTDSAIGLADEKAFADYPDELVYYSTGI